MVILFILTENILLSNHKFQNLLACFESVNLKEYKVNFPDIYLKYNVSYHSNFLLEINKVFMNTNCNFYYADIYLQIVWSDVYQLLLLPAFRGIYVYISNNNKCNEIFIAISFYVAVDQLHISLNQVVLWSKS